MNCDFDKVVIMAPGPSLNKAEIDYVMNKGLFTIVVGNAWRMNPYADLMYHCDNTWWDWYMRTTPDGFKGDQKFSLEPTVYHDVKQMEISPSEFGFDTQWPRLVHGANSTYQAMGLGIHYWAREIILLGVDLKPGPKGEHNIDGDHPPEVKRDWMPDLYIRNFENSVKYLEEMGITVYNCNLDSALNCYPKRKLMDVA